MQPRRDRRTPGGRCLKQRPGLTSAGFRGPIRIEKYDYGLLTM